MFSTAKLLLALALVIFYAGVAFGELLPFSAELSRSWWPMVVPELVSSMATPGQAMTRQSKLSAIDSITLR